MCCLVVPVSVICRHSSELPTYTPCYTSVLSKKSTTSISRIQIRLPFIHNMDTLISYIFVKVKLSFPYSPALNLRTRGISNVLHSKQISLPFYRFIPRVRQRSEVWDQETWYLPSAAPRQPTWLTTSPRWKYSGPEMNSTSLCKGVMDGYNKPYTSSPSLSQSTRYTLYIWCAPWIFSTGDIKTTGMLLLGRAIGSAVNIHVFKVLPLTTFSKSAYFG